MPTVVIGDNTGADIAGCIDTSLIQGAATTNFGDAGSMSIQKYDVGDHNNCVVWFNGTWGISGPVTVNSATLEIYLEDNGGTSTQTISARRVLVSWTSAGATWNSRNGTNNWTTAGCLSDGSDRIASASGTSAAIGSAGAYKSISGAGMAADVEDWINGDASNFGWVLEHANGTNDSQYATFVTTNGTDGQRPRLTVDYTLGGGGGGTQPPRSMHQYRMRRK
jgi:hypothetical protein